MKTTAALLLAIISLITTGLSQDRDPLADAALAAIISGQKGNGVINDNGRNAFVTGDGQGNGVIFQDRGPTYIQKVGDTTFIVPTANPPVPGSGRQR